MPLHKPLPIIALLCVALLLTACTPQRQAVPQETNPASPTAGAILPSEPAAETFPPATITPTPDPTASPAAAPSSAPPPSAQPESYTPQSFAQLRASAPPRFQYSGATRSGEVKIDAPVVLPAVSEMPIKTLREITFSAPELQRIGDVLAQDEMNRGLKSSVGMMKLRLSIRSPAAGQASDSPKSGYSIIYPDWDEPQPQNNPLPPEAPFARVFALLASVFPDAQFYLARQTTTGGGHLVKHNNAHATDEQMNREAPYPGYEMGHYTLLVGQLLDGTPIFPESYFAISAPSDPPDPVVSFRVSPFFDERRFNMDGNVAMPAATLAQDAALAPFVQIEKVIQARIRSGHIRSIDGITLGYMLYYAQPTTILQAAQGADMVAIPTWEVTGGMVYDPSEPGAPVMEKGLFRIDALTGKPLDAYASPAPRVYLLSELLP